MKISHGRTVTSVGLQAVKSFASNEPFAMAASVSYYTLLSMAPLLLVITGVAGFLLGQESVQRQLIEQMRALVGGDGADLIETVIRNASNPSRGLWSMLLGVGLMILGATTVFAQLQAALNRIWGVEVAPSKAVVGFLHTRLISFAMVLGIGFLLLISLIFSAVLAALYDQMSAYLPGAPTLWQLLNEVVSLLLVVVLIAALFKFIPDVNIRWADTWVGALCTGVLFTGGKFAIGLYLGQASIGSAYGAAGSVIVLMVWVYYASLILFFGVELTRAISAHRGHPVRPGRFARLTATAAPTASQGMPHP